MSMTSRAGSVSMYAGRKRTKTRKGRVVKRKVRKSLPYAPYVNRLGSSGFPQFINTRMKYVDYVTFNTVSAPTTKTYGLNCLFDPDLDLGGHQPMGFDQIQVMYGRYRVSAARIRVTVLNTSTASDVVCINMTMNEGNGNFPTSSLNAIETEGYDTAHLTCQDPKQVWPQPYVEKYVRVNDFFKSGPQDALLEADNSANPSRILACQILGGILPAGDSGDINCLVEITFYCTWFNPKNNLAQS